MLGSPVGLRTGTCLGVTPSWITVSPANLHKFPSSEIIGSVAELRIDGVKIDKGVGAGKPSGVVMHFMSDLCDEVTNYVMAFLDEWAGNSVWHAELPGNRVGKVNIRIRASERM